MSDVEDATCVSAKLTRLDDLLILGLGWRGHLVDWDPQYLGNAALSDGAEKYLCVSKDTIVTAKWTAAKASATKRFREHLEREKKRAYYRCVTKFTRGIGECIREFSRSDPESFAAGATLVQEIWDIREAGHDKGSELDPDIEQAMLRRVQHAIGQHGERRSLEAMSGLVAKVGVAIRTLESIVATLPDWVKKVREVGEGLVLVRRGRPGPWPPS